MRRNALLALSLGSAAIAAATAFWLNSHTDSRPERFGPRLQGALDARLVDTLERDPAWAAAHAWPRMRPICAANVLGAEPAGVTNAEEATTLYAWVNCSFLDPAHPTAESAAGMSVPIVVRFGTPNEYDLPKDGSAFRESVRAAFPASLHDLVLGDADVRPDDSAVDRRVAELVATTPTESRPPR